MANGHQRRKSASAEQRMQVVIGVVRLAAQVAAILHNWLSGGRAWMAYRKVGDPGPK